MPATLFSCKARAFAVSGDNCLPLSRFPQDFKRSGQPSRGMVGDSKLPRNRSKRHTSGPQTAHSRMVLAIQSCGSAQLPASRRDASEARSGAFRPLHTLLLRQCRHPGAIQGPGRSSFGTAGQAVRVDS